MTLAVETTGEVQVDGVALWADADQFLDWCREHGVKGRIPNPYNAGPFITDCLVAQALRQLTGVVWRVGRLEASAADGRGFRMPRWMSEITRRFDTEALTEFVAR